VDGVEHVEMSLGAVSDVKADTVDCENEVLESNVDDHRSDSHSMHT
jgi:hypothetical protein